MALRTVKLAGTDTSDASMTILWDGVEVVTGVVTPTTPDSDGASIVATWTFEDNGTTDINDHTLSVTVDSGSIKPGPLWFSAAGVHNEDGTLGSVSISEAADLPGAGYWVPGDYGPFGDDTDLTTALFDRSNILINGAVPTLEAGQTTTGTAEAPTWNGWFFFMGAGDTMTCTARAPAVWTAWVPKVPA